MKRDADVAVGKPFTRVPLPTIAEAEAAMRLAVEKDDFSGQFKALIPISVQKGDWDSERPRKEIENGESILLSEVFPDVQPVGFEEFVREWWGPGGVYERREKEKGEGKGEKRVAG